MTNGVVTTGDSPDMTAQIRAERRARLGRSRRAAALTAGAFVAIAGLALAAGPAAAAVRTPSASTTCAACGHNLIENPGAESGVGATSDLKVVVPDWKATGSFTAASYAWSGGDISATSPGPTATARGKNYFYGGPESPTSTGSQTVTIAASGISTGKVTYALSGWLGGYSTQQDKAVLTVKFENSKSTVLSTATLGPVTAAQRKDDSELLLRSAAGKVPATTTKLLITLTMTRESGSDNDGLADALSLIFTDPK